MTSLYDICGEKFFTPLASKNRKIYIDTILYLKQVINELFETEENDKSKIVDILANHLDEKVSIKLYNDDSNDEIETEMDNKFKAQLLISKLEEYDWLIEEALGNGKKTLDFNSHAYSFIALIEELINNSRPQYTSYIRIIKNEIYKFDYSTVDSIQIVDDNLSKEVEALRGLRSDIRRYYRNITKNKDKKSLEALLEEFTGEYKEYFFDSAYLNLKIRDNIDASIPEIEEQLDVIFSDFLNMEKLVGAQMKEKGYEDYDVASNYIEQMKRRILSNVKSIPSIIEMIDSKNEKYVTRTVSVIIHLINRGEDIEGILHRLIDYVKKNDDIDESFISLFEMKHYTFDALSKPRKYNPKPKPTIMALDYEMDEEVKNKTLEILQEDKKYNIRAVNDFVLKFLGGYESRKISELDIESKYELIDISMVKNIVEEIKKDHMCIKLSDLKVDGYDMIQLGFYKKGIGDVLNYLLEAVLDEKVSNDKEDLIRSAKKFKYQAIKKGVINFLKSHPFIL